MYNAVKHAIWLKVAADKMHAELLSQCSALIGAEAGTEAADTLKRLAALVDEYEDVRWSIDKSHTDSNTHQ